MTAKIIAFFVQCFEFSELVGVRISKVPLDNFQRHILKSDTYYKVSGSVVHVVWYILTDKCSYRLDVVLISLFSR